MFLCVYKVRFEVGETSIALRWIDKVLQIVISVRNCKISLGSESRRVGRWLKLFL